MIRIAVLLTISYSWVAVALMVMTTMAASSIQMGLGVLFPFIQEDLGTSRAELGIIASGVYVGGIATVLLTGWLVDVVGVRRLQTMAQVALVVGVLLISQIQSPAQGFFVALVIGVAVGVKAPAYTKAIMDWVRPQTRAISIGITEASIPIGGIIAAVLLPVLAVSLSWRSALFVFGLAIAVTSVVFFAFYRDKRGSYLAEDKKSGTGGRVTLVAKNRDIWLLSFYATALTGCQIVIVSYLVLFLTEYLGMSAVRAGGFLAVAMAGGAVGRLGWGLVSDLAMGGRRVPPLVILGIVSLVPMSLLVWLPSDASPAVVGALVFVVGTTVMGWTAVWATLLAELAGPALSGTSIGFASMVIRGGVIGVIPIFGFIVDRTGSYDTGWWALAGLVGVGTIMLALLGPEARCR